MVMNKYSYLNKLYLISVGQINVFIRKALYTVAYVFIRTISTLQEALSSSAFSALHKKYSHNYIYTNTRHCLQLLLMYTVWRTEATYSEQNCTSFEMKPEWSR